MSFCKNCKVELDEVNCYRKSNGYLRVYCKSCHNKKSNNYNKISSKQPHRKKLFSNRKKLYRSNPDNIPQIIYEDSRKSDKKHNRKNDLTKDFIKEKIVNGCSYCLETKLRMTLDRIDNNLGHLQSNVVSACIRCNYARGAMPYKAWLCLVSGLREANKQGLFEGWTGRCR